MSYIQLVTNEEGWTQGLGGEGWWSLEVNMALEKPMYGDSGTAQSMRWNDNVAGGTWMAVTVVMPIVLLSVD